MINNKKNKKLEQLQIENSANVKRPLDVLIHILLHPTIPSITVSLGLKRINGQL
jgi:hypothetical protein